MTEPVSQTQHYPNELSDNKDLEVSSDIPVKQKPLKIFEVPYFSNQRKMPGMFRSLSLFCLILAL